MGDDTRDGTDDGTDDGDILQGAPLVVRQGGGAWRVPSTDAWQDERSLQTIVSDNPTLLPGIVGTDAATVQEFPIYDAGRVDIFCVEPDGTLTICEVKLRRNPEIRRQVLGQVLAYAAGLTQMTYEEVDRVWRSRTGAGVAESVLGEDIDPADVAAFQDSVRARLRGGRFRLVLAVDELTDELRNTITYLSEHTDADMELVALELAYARDGDVEILVPRAWGLTSPARHRSRSSASPRGTRLTLEEAGPLFDAAESVHPGAGELVRQLLSRLSPQLSYLYVGDPQRIAEMGCVVVADDPIHCQPLAIRPAQKLPGVRICFDWMRRLGEERLDQLLDGLEAHPALAPALAGVREANFRKRPLVAFDVLEDPEVVDLIVEQLQRALSPIEQGEDVVPVREGTFDPVRLHHLMAAIPRGSWITYGDLASLTGTIGKALGSHIKSCPECPNAARVLPQDGKPAEGFTRTDSADHRTQRQELEADGISFIGDRADPGRKISPAELLRLGDQGDSAG